jgi:hypothetical protein
MVSSAARGWVWWQDRQEGVVEQVDSVQPGGYPDGLVQHHDLGVRRLAGQTFAQP